ncbi:crotonase/enoyl-CoA hydratase family protein [Thalassotalea aquiviva]|uniref:crotonase/enoyl-CoA hydratase family protein n=1 Tax=Thalassotalea aquiviva TaxID=3242415 RepID=UPI00352A1ED4
MAEDVLLVEVKNQIAFVSLNRPQKHNALNLALFKALDHTIKRLDKQKNIRAIIVFGNGPDFCTGLDINSVMKSKTAALTLLYKWWPGKANLAQRVSYGWRQLNVPVIMAIHGRCWGGGLQIALGADFRLVSTDSTFSVMESKWGLIPDMAGNLALRELVRKDIALKLAMTAEIIDAKTAQNLGLVSEVCADPLAGATLLAEQISARSPDSVAAVKALYHRLWQAKDWRWLARESWYQIRILAGKNQKIAVKNQLKPHQQADYQPRSRW